ncbi:MAG: exosortase/archaeosortase family protein [archaeon]|jgi:exosortase/archaeosortase family protein
MKQKLFEKEISSVKKYWQGQEKKIVASPRKQFTFFILTFVLSYLILTALVSPFELGAKEFTGKSAEIFLAAGGNSISESGFYTATDGEVVYSFFANDKQIIISWLCSGVLEIIILICAMLASFGIAFRQKLIGIGIAIVAGVIFNTLRIWITLSLILTQNAAVFEIAHDLLFRIVLFVYIIIVYVIWFYWTQVGTKELIKIVKSNNYFKKPNKFHKHK